jgi:hypothetical protein
MASATRVACDEEGNGNGGKSDGNEVGRRAMVTRAMAMEKVNNNQPVTGSTKPGGGWRESINKATTRPQRWATTNNKSVQLIMMAATKRARVARAMVMTMSVAGKEEGKGITGHCISNKDGVQHRGQWRRRQEGWQQG